MATRAAPASSTITPRVQRGPLESVTRQRSRCPPGSAVHKRTAAYEQPVSDCTAKSIDNAHTRQKWRVRRRLWRDAVETRIRVRDTDVTGLCAVDRAPKDPP